MKRFFLVFSILIIIPASLFALDIPSRKIEDDSSLRISLMNSWFTETPGRVLNKTREYHTLKGGARVEVRSEDGGDEFLVVLGREFPANNFPGWAQGSWILARKKSDGIPVRIRVFLKSDPNMYVQFTPFTNDKCYMDVVVYGGFVLHLMPLPIPFERLLVMPLEEVLAAAGGRFPRRYFDAEPGMYADESAFISAVRKKLPDLSFTDDGAIDENGDYVFIDTLESQNPSSPAMGGLNCSGFAKWLVDGILRPVSGGTLPIAPLKEAFGERGSSFTAPWERIRDPFFGLDWCRNLAARAGLVLRSPSFAALEEFEVRSWPFARIIARRNGESSVRSYPGFLPEAGFGVEGLHALLYTLAVDEPGKIYLAAVNNEIGAPVTKENMRGLPRLRQYFHIAALVPYFNEYGNFEVVVFESAAETSFAAFRNRYPGHYVNLVRIPIEGTYAF